MKFLKRLNISYSSMPNRLVFNGTEKPNEDAKSAPVAVPDQMPVNPKEQADKAKDTAAGLVRIGADQADQLQAGKQETKEKTEQERIDENKQKIEATDQKMEAAMKIFLSLNTLTCEYNDIYQPWESALKQLNGPMINALKATSMKTIVNQVVQKNKVSNEAGFTYRRLPYDYFNDVYKGMKMSHPDAGGLGLGEYDSAEDIAKKITADGTADKFISTYDKKNSELLKALEPVIARASALKEAAQKKMEAKREEEEKKKKA